MLRNEVQQWVRGSRHAEGLAPGSPWWTHDSTLQNVTSWAGQTIGATPCEGLVPELWEAVVTAAVVVTAAREADGLGRA